MIFQKRFCYTDLLLKKHLLLLLSMFKTVVLLYILMENMIGLKEQQSFELLKKEPYYSRRIIV